jgi:hypothetical protein
LTTGVSIFSLVSTLGVDAGWGLDGCFGLSRCTGWLVSLLTGTFNLRNAKSLPSLKATARNTTLTFPVRRSRTSANKSIAAANSSQLASLVVRGRMGKSFQIPVTSIRSVPPVTLASLSNAARPLLESSTPDVAGANSGEYGRQTGVSA